MVFMIVPAFLAVLAASTLAVLLLWSWPGKPKPFRDKTRPVLLYLHGGMPEYFLTQRHPTDLEAEFVVCWWEQRGAGLSYRPGMSTESLTVGQLVDDTLALTNHLRRRFGKDRIYLMGHSGGSFIGMHAVARAPELYHAYIGVAQMANQLRSETRAYEYMLGRCRTERRTALARKLEAAPVTLDGGVPPSYVRVRDEAMHALGVGTMREMRSVVTGLFLTSLRKRDYTLAEKINLWRGKAATGVSSMWKEMLATDLAERVPSVGAPVYFLHGVHDYTCTYAAADLLKSKTFDHICGVETASLPLVGAIGYKDLLSTLYLRKKRKEYGMKRVVAGIYKPGESVYIIDDVSVEATPTLAFVKAVESEGLKVKGVIVAYKIVADEKCKNVFEDLGYEYASMFSYVELSEVL